MGKYKYTAEFEVRANNKMLFNYLVTPAGLAQWFADQVTVDENKNFNFLWDNQPHYARIAAQRLNRYVKFEFIAEDSQLLTDPSYIEFKVDMNDLTQSSFLKITDYSDIENEQDLRELWTYLVSNLREIVGG
jgi:uncharacterized protein YndB with AHSA1/START domain